MDSAKISFNLSNASFGANAGFDVQVGTPAEFTSVRITVEGKRVCDGVMECNGAKFTAPEAMGPVTLGIEVTRVENAGAGQVTLACFGTDGVPVGSTGNNSSSSSSSSSTTQTTNTTLAAGGAAGGAIGGAIGAALGGGGGGVQATRDSFRFSTQGVGDLSRGWDAWIIGQGRIFGGSLSGGGFEGTVGAHVNAGPNAKIGVLLSYGDYSITQGATTTNTSALTYGPYFKLAISPRYQLDGYLAFATPSYTTGAVSYTAARTIGGLNVRARYDIGGIEIDSFLGLRGFSEALPAASGAARTITSYTGSIGSKAKFNPGAPLRPYVSLAGEYNSFSNGLGTTTDSLAPRLGLGVDYTGAAGNLSVNLDGGQLFQGAQDYGFGVTYETSW
ncbi:hypothetical protein [Anianabacter salinae]|uniref:hypothetical protein n=1 Tax=Anianabacter salinae TaxID=2851023 RepID=UPI00225DEEC8|nr:hypothetical protein [Anianabacter salinae]MBV0911235.1 hypothetical protein [Anianabacter salinae]